MSEKPPDIESLNRDLQKKNQELEKAFAELDRRVYHLKTLNDISKNIFGTIEFKAIIDHFLLMIMGNFGVIEGFAMTQNPVDGEITHFKATGYDDDELDLLKAGAATLIRSCNGGNTIKRASIQIDPEVFAPHTVCALPFKVTAACSGFLGLGAKLIGDPFTADDKELIVTLANSLVVSLTNALSFEDIKTLNDDLRRKNEELKAALRKIELLEGIKANLTKFVPTVVSRLVEKSPTSEVQDAQEQDISVLFLDIEGYTKLTDEIGATEVNTLIEKYFSVFMDAIYANQGDIVETAGDGLMVLFMAADQKENALQAIRAAAMIRDKACGINEACTMDEKPCLVNVGVCSGKAFVGAAKFESITGSRWAYTTHGNTVNIAARLCGRARGGEVFCAGTTVERVKDDFAFTSRGRFALKNLPQKIEIFQLK